MLLGVRRASLLSLLIALGACHRARCDALDAALASRDEVRFAAAVRAGETPACRDDAGWPLLHRAARQGRTQAIAALLDAGADLRGGGPHRRTALYEAAKHGHAATVGLLLDRGADPNIREDDSGFAPLHIAAERRHIEVIRVLLARGAEVNALNRRSQTPLWQASWRSEHGDAAVARALIAAGAATEVHDIAGITPLMAAAEHGHRPFAEALLDAGANPNATDDEGYTAMDWAAAHRRGELVALLRARGGRRGAR